MEERHITGPDGGDLNDRTTITADGPGPGGASHVYKIEVEPEDGEPLIWVIPFQKGAIKEVGYNGLSTAALLTVLIDHMGAFQRGPYACEENEIALAGLKMALTSMKLRTRRRQARGVEGTHTV
jgi:hypothetical protein